MSDDTSEPQVEDDISIDELDTDVPEAMLTTMESAPDEAVPSFAKPAAPSVENAADGEVPAAGATKPGGTPTETADQPSKPPPKVPTSKRPTPLSGLPLPSSKIAPRSGLPRPRSVPPSKLPPPPRSKLPTLSPRSSPPSAASRLPSSKKAGGSEPPKKRMSSSRPPSQPPPGSPLPPRSTPPRPAGPGSTPPPSALKSSPPRANSDLPTTPKSTPPRPRSRPPGSTSEALDIPSSALKSSPPPDILSFDEFDEDEEMDRPTLVHNPGTGGSSIEDAVDTARRAAELAGTAMPDPTGPDEPPPNPAPLPPRAEEPGLGEGDAPAQSGGSVNLRTADLPFFEDDEVDGIDLAQTVKLERKERASVPPDDDDDDASPPDVPSIAKDSSKGRKRSDGRRRRSRRGKRRMVKIPDDNVPATPTPPAVEGRDPMDSLTDELEGRASDLPEPTPSDVPSDDARDSELPVTYSEPPDDIDAGARQSAPGIFTDDAAIAVLRPIQVTNDLPAMEPEEIEPEPDEPPRPPPQRAAGDSEPVRSKPKLPPRRGELDSIDNIEELVPEEIAVPPLAAEDLAGGNFDGRGKPPKPPPPRIGVADATGGQVPLTPADLANLDLGSAGTDTALAEARAREAEARAVEAEARAKAAAAKAEAARVTAQKKQKKAWWAKLYEGELIQTLDNPQKRDVENEVDFLVKTMRLDDGARVLDLACGAGVHAAELSKRGYQVVGVDHSETMLDLARAYNKQRGTAVSLIQGDMRQLSLEGIFDGIYCWGASFGYFDEAQNAKVLERVCRALRPGGVFALDVPNRDYVAPRAPHMAWFEKPGVVCMDEMRFDFYSSRMITKRMVLFETGKSQELEMSMRLYTLTELGRLFHKVGLKVLEVSGHRVHRGAYFGAESPRTMITGRRRDDDE
jgi:SAM-dependent methyltransferase